MVSVVGSNAVATPATQLRVVSDARLFEKAFTMLEAQGIVKPLARPLKLGELSNAVDTYSAAFADHPFARFLWFDVPDIDQSPRFTQRWRASNALKLLDSMRRREAWTVGGGDAVIQYSYGKNLLPRWKRIVESITSAIKNALITALMSLNSKEQKLRATEYGEKLGAAIQEAFGSQIDNMMSLDGLGTAPSKQGLGYASALVEIVANRADALALRTWVITAHQTTSFYQQFGFVIVKEFPVGEDNPRWNEPPCVVSLMIRDPVKRVTEYSD